MAFSLRVVTLSLSLSLRRDDDVNVYCAHLETGNGSWPQYCCASFNPTSFQC